MSAYAILRTVRQDRRDMDDDWARDKGQAGDRDEFYRGTNPSGGGESRWWHGTSPGKN